MSSRCLLCFILVIMIKGSIQTKSFFLSNSYTDTEDATIGNYNSARDFCISHGGDIAMPKTVEEREQLRELFPGGYGQWYLGMYMAEGGIPTFLDGEVPTNGADAWGPDMPDTTMPCVMMMSDGFWYSRSCDHPAHFACQVEEAEQEVTCRDGWSMFGGKCYKLGDGSLSYTEAEQRCAELLPDAILAMPTDQDVNDFILSLRLSRRDRIWVGLEDRDEEGVFQFADGQGLGDFVNWNREQPDNWRGRENCVQLLRNGRWNDKNCEQSNPFVCEKTPLA